MKKQLTMAAVLLVCVLSIHAQPWTYDFGTGTGVHNSGASTTFLPTPSSGTARVRVGTTGGSFNLENPGLAGLGSASELRIVAPTTASVNKYSIYDYTPAKVFYTKFDILLGNSSGGNTATSGTFSFWQGDGAMYSDNNAFTGAQAFTGIRWVFGASGAITTSYRNVGAWSALGSTPFYQGSVYTVEIYGNNGTTTVSYSRGVYNYSIDANTQDIWVEGTLVGDNLAKAQLANNSNIDSFLFYGESSTSNVANCFLDDITYSNALPLYTPVLSVSTPTLSGFSYIVGNGPSEEQNFILTGTNLTADVNLSVGDWFEIASATGGPYGSSLIYTPTDGSVSVTVYVRMKADYPVGIYNDVVSVYTDGAEDKTVTLSGHVDEPLPIVLSSFTASISAQNYVTLTWVTQTETGMAGYYIYRALNDQLSTAQIVSPLVDAVNGSQQHIYTYTDSDLYNSGTYFYWLESRDIDGNNHFFGPISIIYDNSGEYYNPEIPLLTELKSVYPNPFNPTAFIPFSLAATNNVSFKIYNNRGQIVRDIDLGSKIPGEYRITWDGTDNNGQTLANGVYYIRMSAGKDSFQRKAVLLK